jgi:hypothetical protein
MFGQKGEENIFFPIRPTAGGDLALENCGSKKRLAKVKFRFVKYADEYFTDGVVSGSLSFKLPLILACS